MFQMINTLFGRLDLIFCTSHTGEVYLCRPLPGLVLEAYNAWQFWAIQSERRRPAGEPSIVYLYQYLRQDLSDPANFIIDDTMARRKRT